MNSVEEVLDVLGLSEVDAIVISKDLNAKEIT
jgi:hypothetical protein